MHIDVTCSNGEGLIKKKKVFYKGKNKDGKDRQQVREVAEERKVKKEV